MLTVNSIIQNQNISLSWSNQEKLLKIFNFQTRNNFNLENLVSNISGNIQWNYNRIFAYNSIAVNMLNNVLDIGSGISLTDLAIAKLNPNINFYLLDESKIDYKKHWQYFSKENKHGFYNDWDVVLDCINNSALDSKKFTFLNPNSMWPENLDLIMSLNSWCWHYPKEVYWRQTLNSLKIGGFLVLDILNIPNRDLILEISEELKSKPNYVLRYLPTNYKHPFIDELTLINNSYGGCYCWTRRK